LPPFAPNYKKCPQLEKTFLNSINTFAPNLKKCPRFFLNYHLKKNLPPLKNLPPFLSNLSIPNGIEKKYMDPGL